MLLYHGMYNVAHFEINNSVPLYTNTVVGDAYDYKRLRKVCFESGGAYINSSEIDGKPVRGGAHVTIQEDSIFMSIVPETSAQGIVIGLTFFLDGNDMKVYAEKRSGGGGGDTGVQSWNGRDGNVIPADHDYDGGMVDYDNSLSGLVSDNVQNAIDELAQENEGLSDDIEDAQEDIGDLQEDVSALETKLTNGYLWVEDVVITNSNTTDDCATRLKDLADAVVSYCAALPADEIAVVTHFNGFNYELIPLITKSELDNTISSLNLFAERNDVSSSLPGLSSRIIRCSTTAANNYYYALTIKTDGTMALTDNSATTNSYNVSIHLNRFKKL